MVGSGLMFIIRLKLQNTLLSLSVVIIKFSRPLSASFLFARLISHSLGILFCFKYFYYISFWSWCNKLFFFLLFSNNAANNIRAIEIIVSLLLLFPFQLQECNSYHSKSIFWISLLLLCLEVISCALLNDKTSANSNNFCLTLTTNEFLAHSFISVYSLISCWMHVDSSLISISLNLLNFGSFKYAETSWNLRRFPSRSYQLDRSLQIFVLLNSPALAFS